jgi:hypothetical protein
MAPTTPPTVAAPSSTPLVPTATPAPQGSELLFLREGRLFAYDLLQATERELLADVSAMAATPDGQQLIVVLQNEIWRIDRDGNDRQQLTTNEQFEASLSLSADGQTLAYVASALEPPRPLDRTTWAEWCQGSEVRVLELSSGQEQTLGSGCDVAISADGQRLAFATPPSSATPQTAANELFLFLRNQQGNWEQFETINPQAQDGLLVYAPSFAPDDGELAYQQYMGNQIETEVMYLQALPAGQSERTLLGLGTGWLTPVRYSPDGRYGLAVEYIYDDARGFSGYDIWRAMVLERGTPSEFVAPLGTFSTTAAMVERLSRATSAAWAPDGSQVALLLPGDWLLDAPPGEPMFANENPGEIHLWQPGEPPGPALIRNVDYASPLLWLPAATN